MNNKKPIYRGSRRARSFQRIKLNKEYFVKRYNLMEGDFELNKM
jgi:hypothetical protein